MKLWQMGLPAVSPFGWSLTQEQVAIIGELTRGVVALPDRDKQEAFAPFAHALSKVVWTKCPELPEVINDPEYLTLDQIKGLT